MKSKKCAWSQQEQVLYEHSLNNREVFTSEKESMYLFTIKTQQTWHIRLD